MNLIAEINNALMLSCYPSKRAFAIKNGINVNTFNKTLHRIMRQKRIPNGYWSEKIVSTLKDETGYDLRSVINRE